PRPAARKGSATGPAPPPTPRRRRAPIRWRGRSDGDARPAHSDERRLSQRKSTCEPVLMDRTDATPCRGTLAVLALTALLSSAAWLGAPPAGAAGVSPRGSARQVDVTGARAGARLVLLNRSGRVVGSRRADSLGGVLFRGVAPGRGYRVRQGGVRSG